MPSRLPSVAVAVVCTPCGVRVVCVVSGALNERLASIPFRLFNTSVDGLSVGSPLLVLGLCGD